MKRRDLERHLRAEGCRQIDEGARSIVSLGQVIGRRLAVIAVEERVEVEVRDVDRARHELRE